jgi:hypothetical protein
VYLERDRGPSSGPRALDRPESPPVTAELRLAPSTPVGLQLTHMTTRERIDQLLDQLPEAQLEEVRADLERRADPVGWLFAHAPEGPPLSEEERAAVAEAWAETEPPVPLEEFRREFGR